MGEEESIGGDVYGGGSPGQLIIASAWEALFMPEVQAELRRRFPATGEPRLGKRGPEATNRTSIESRTSASVCLGRETIELWGQGGRARPQGCKMVGMAGPIPPKNYLVLGVD